MTTNIKNEVTNIQAPPPMPTHQRIIKSPHKQPNMRHQIRNYKDLQRAKILLQEEVAINREALSDGIRQAKRNFVISLGMSIGSQAKYLLMGKAFKLLKLKSIYKIGKLSRIKRLISRR